MCSSGRGLFRMRLASATTRVSRFATSASSFINDSICLLRRLSAARSRLISFSWRSLSAGVMMVCFRPKIASVRFRPKMQLPQH